MSGLILALLAAPGLVLEVRPDRSEYRAGDPVQVICFLSNRGTTPVTIPALFVPGSAFFGFEVLGADGRPIPYRGPERKIALSGRHLVTLEPGMLVGASLDLTGRVKGEHWYDLGRRGAYTVRALLVVEEDSPSSKKPGFWKGRLGSAPVRITIR